MDTLVIRLAGRHGRVAELARSQDGSLSVGRGYDNDLVLTDHHVDPRQLSFSREEGQWMMRVLDNTNPVLVNNKHVDDEALAVSSGDQVTVGRTRLVLYAADHPVEPTRRLVLSNWVSAENIGLLTALLVLLLVSGLDLLLVHFEASMDLDWATTGYSILFSAVTILVWAGLWALAGRIVRQQHNFGLQLVATAVVSLLTTLVVFVVAYIAYPFHSYAVSETLDWATAFLMLLLLLHLNLMIATNMRNTLPVAVIISGLLVGVSFIFTQYYAEEAAHYVPEYSDTLLPPPASVLPGVSLDDYFADLAVEMRSIDME